MARQKRYKAKTTSKQPENITGIQFSEHYFAVKPKLQLINVIDKLIERKKEILLNKHWVLVVFLFFVILECSWPVYLLLDHHLHVLDVIMLAGLEPSTELVRKPVRKKCLLQQIIATGKSYRFKKNYTLEKL